MLVNTFSTITISRQGCLYISFFAKYGEGLKSHLLLYTAFQSISYTWDEKFALLVLFATQIFQNSEMQKRKHTNRKTPKHQNKQNNHNIRTHRLGTPEPRVARSSREVVRLKMFFHETDYLALLSNELFIFIFVYLLDNGGN